MQKELPLESCFHLKLPIGVGNKIKFNEPYLQLIKARIIFQRFLDLAQCTELVILDVDRAPWDFWQVNQTELLVLHLAHNLLIDKGGDAKILRHHL